MRIRRFRSPAPRGLDVATFLEVYDKHAEGLLRFFARRTLVPEVAADLTAETFAEAFASRGQFDPCRGEPGAWLYAIARHELGSYLRRLRVERRARDRLHLPDRTPEPEDCDRIEALIDFAAVGYNVRAALQDLPSEQREAVISRIIDELSYDEVAERLGCSEQAARARVSRGLRTLARALAPPTDYCPEPGAHT